MHTDTNVVWHDMHTDTNVVCTHINNGREGGVDRYYWESNCGKERKQSESVIAQFVLAHNNKGGGMGLGDHDPFGSFEYPYTHVHTCMSMHTCHMLWVYTQYVLLPFWLKNLLCVIVFALPA